MERIKLALEKARQEREKAAAHSAPPPSGEVATAEAGEITYTTTRTVAVSPTELRRHHIIVDPADSAVSDAYKILRTQVLQRLRENNWNALAVTSPGANAGSTVSAINLAISMALEVNHTVLLVDANLREPSVAACLGLEVSGGLSDYLRGNAQLPDLLVNPAGYTGFVVLPAGAPLPNSAEMLGSPRMSQLVDELKARYPSRIVIFDLPPLLTAADALAFAPYVDAALLVVEDRKTKIADVHRALELLEGTNVIGTILNKNPSRSLARRQDSKAGWLSRIFSNRH